MTSVRYSRQVKSKMKSKDVFLGITTSGESINIIEALKECKNWCTNDFIDWKIRW